MNLIKLLIISLIYQNNFDKHYTQQLIRESSFITEHLVRGSQNQSSFPCSRINFICCSTNLREGTRNYGGISEIDVLFDPTYFSLSAEQKERYLFDFLYSSMFRFCKFSKLNFSHFQDLFQEIKNNNYSSHFYTKLESQYNGIHARLFGVQQMDKLLFYLEFSGRNRKPTTMFLFDSKPNAFDYDRCLGRLEWQESQKIDLIGKDGNVFLSATLTSDCCEPE